MSIEPFWNELIRKLLPLVIPVAVTLGFLLLCALAGIVIRIIGPWMNLERVSTGVAMRIAAMSFLAATAPYSTLAFYSGYARGLTQFDVSNSGRNMGGFPDNQVAQLAHSPMAGLLAGVAGLAVAGLIAARAIRDAQGEQSGQLSFPNAVAFTCAYFTATATIAGILLMTVIGILTLLA